MNFSITLNLSKIPYPAEKSVGHTRCAPGPFCNLKYAFLISFNLEEIS